MSYQATYTVQNRNDISLAVVVTGSENRDGLAFVAHGLGGFKEQRHIVAMAEALEQLGYCVVRYDAANSIGESGGQMQDATLTNYYADLEDIVEWASTQPFFQAPFFVGGHSLGAACSLLFAAQHSAQVRGIFPISCFVGGERYKKIIGEEKLAQWQKDGFIFEESGSRPGVMKRLNWGLIEDLERYDLVANEAAQIDVPTLLVVGTKDVGTPPEFQEQLKQNISSPCELHLIGEMEHNPKTDAELEELQAVLTTWVKSLQ